MYKLYIEMKRSPIVKNGKIADKEDYSVTMKFDNLSEAKNEYNEGLADFRLESEYYKKTDAGVYEEIEMTIGNEDEEVTSVSDSFAKHYEIKGNANGGYEILNTYKLADMDQEEEEGLVGY